MPQVGRKKFGYDPAGMLEAQRESRRTGRPLRNTGQPTGNRGMNRMPRAPRSLQPMSRRPMQSPGRPVMPPRRPMPGQSMAGNQGNNMGGQSSLPLQLGLNRNLGTNRPNNQTSVNNRPTGTGSGGPRNMRNPGIGYVLTGRNRNKRGY